MKLVRSTILVAAIVVPLVPSAAHADRYAHTDATADVVSYAKGAQTGVAAPERVEDDIVRTRVVHRDRAAILTTRYRELSPADEKVHAFAVRTSKMARYVYVYAGKGHWAGDVEMTNARDKKVSCHVARRIDYTANTVSIRIPRSCLGRPRWVRAAMFVGAFTSATQMNPIYVDDANTNGDFAEPRWSPRVYR